MNTREIKMATDKQIQWIHKLAAEKGVEYMDLVRQATVASVLEGNQISRAAASDLLDLMFEYQPVNPEAVEEPGMYRVEDGTVYRVQFNQSETNLYAKELLIEEDGNRADGSVKYRGRLVYAGGTERLGIKKSHRLTLEEAIIAGKGFGICMVCGAELENEKSIERGIGPTCQKRV